MGMRPYERVPKPLHVLQPAHISRVTGVSLNTVKDRIALMAEKGIIAGYHAVPNLQHLGLRGEAYYLRFPTHEAKDAALPRILQTEGLLELHDFMGKGACADFAFHDDSELRTRLGFLQEVSGDNAPQRFYYREMPRVDRDLTPLDWRILQALRADPRAQSAELAPTVGISARTVKRHLARMAAEGSVFLVPAVDPSKAEGLFIFEMLVYLRDGSGPRPMSELRAAFDDEHVYAYVPASAGLGHFDMLLFARTSAEVETIRRRAEQIDGVLRAEAWLFRAFLAFPAWLDAAIEQAATSASHAGLGTRTRGASRDDPEK
jgi:DNA-binding Lrp family transcriptional regulator